MASPERLLTCGSKHPMPTSPRAFQLNGVYTQRFNRTHARVGHGFQGRFKAILVHKDSYLLELARYVVLNPLRAKMIRSLERWRWSSYPATCGHALQVDLAPVENLNGTCVLWNASIDALLQQATARIGALNQRQPESTRYLF